MRFAHAVPSTALLSSYAPNRRIQACRWAIGDNSRRDFCQQAKSQQAMTSGGRMLIDSH